MPGQAAGTSGVQWLVPEKLAAEMVLDSHQLGHTRIARAGKDTRRSAHLQRHASVQNHDAVGQPPRLVQVMRHQHHRDGNALAQRRQLVVQGLARGRIHRRKRLVQQQHLRLTGQRARQCHALLLAARELRRPALLQPGQPHALEQGIQ